jgi:hypothetical protein
LRPYCRSYLWWSRRARVPAQCGIEQRGVGASRSCWPEVEDDRFLFLENKRCSYTSNIIVSGM